VVAEWEGSEASPFDGLLQALEDDLPAVLDEVVRLLRVDWPDYAAFLADERDEVAHAGRSTVGRIVRTAERAWSAGRAVVVDEGDVPDPDLELFADLGRAQCRSGTALAALLSAYQVGAQVAWRVVSQTAVQRGMPADCVALLAESVFVLVAQLSSTSTRGYLEEQSWAVADRERARAELAELLLSDRSDSGLVRAAAQRADWPLPRSVALVLLEPGDERSRSLLFAADPAHLPLHRTGTVGVIVPDPDGPGRRERLLSSLAGSDCVIGRTVPPDQLPASLRTTQLALRLRGDGVLHSGTLHVEDHLAALVVHSDTRLIDALRARVLAPLEAVPAETRERLEETLVAWLAHMGDRQRVAAELHVHRQTVRYRLAQVAELYGGGLEDPSVRMELLLALWWRVSSRAPGGS
jgi:hypothetical protein